MHLAAPVSLMDRIAPGPAAVSHGLVTSVGSVSEAYYVSGFGGIGLDCISFSVVGCNASWVQRHRV